MPEITSYAPGAPSWVDLSTTDDKEALGFLWRSVQMGGRPSGDGSGFLLPPPED